MAIPTDNDFMKGLFKGRALAIWGILLSGVIMSSAFWMARSCSKPNHMKAAYDRFEVGDWNGALREASLQLEVEPDNPEAILMMADSHAAMADQTRGNFEEYVGHVCSAIHFYQLRLDRGFINNIASKKAIFEERNQEMISPEGRYARCNEGEAEIPTE